MYRRPRSASCQVEPSGATISGLHPAETNDTSMLVSELSFFSYGKEGVRAAPKWSEPKQQSSVHARSQTISFTKLEAGVGIAPTSADYEPAKELLLQPALITRSHRFAFGLYEAMARKVFKTTWQIFEGGLCAIVVGRDSARREVSVAVPAGAFQVLAAEARRRLAAAKSLAERGWLPPQWHQVNFLSVQTMTVGTTDNQKVGVILDRGLETEFGLSLAPEHALELGRQLIAEADKTPTASSPSRMN